MVAIRRPRLLMRAGQVRDGRVAMAAGRLANGTHGDSRPARSCAGSTRLPFRRRGGDRGNHRYRSVARDGRSDPYGRGDAHRSVTNYFDVIPETVNGVDFLHTACALLLKYRDPECWGRRSGELPGSQSRSAHHQTFGDRPGPEELRGLRGPSGAITPSPSDSMYRAIRRSAASAASAARLTTASTRW
jgi:hypothetical protein